MEGQTFTEEIDCGNIFDHFDDLIEFPSVTDNYVDSNEFANIWTNNSDGLHGSDSIFSDSNGASALSAELDVPYEDMVQLEWLSNFVEDSFSGGGMTINKENVLVKNEPLAVTNYQFQTSSPTSVLESSSSSSSSSPSYSGSGGGNGGGGRMIPLSPTHRGPQRARTKRPRPPAFHPRAAIGLLSSSNLVQVPISMESDNTPKMGSSGPEQKKRKKKPEAQAVDPEDKSENHNKTGQGVRKCLHCEITKTPQWRAGPMGPKTLCNACGVRYKSGRLFPEYRPAASPTFVPSLHSNSHKKVVEMRCKAMVIGGLPEPEPELIPNLNPPPADYI